MNSFVKVQTKKFELVFQFHFLLKKTWRLKGLKRLFLRNCRLLYLKSQDVCFENIFSSNEIIIKMPF